MASVAYLRKVEERYQAESVKGGVKPDQWGGVKVGKRSLLDFCHLFFGGGKNTGPEVLPYTIGDIVAGLNAIAKYDWNGFLQQALLAKSPDTLLEGLRAGYELIFQGQPSEMERSREDTGHHLDARFSLGSSVREDGTVDDVIVNLPLYVAKVPPGSKIVKGNGQIYTADTLRRRLTRR